MEKKEVKISTVCVDGLPLVFCLFFLVGCSIYLIFGYQQCSEKNEVVAYVAYVVYFIFIIFWIGSFCFTIFFIKEKMNHKKFISSSLSTEDRYGQWRFIEIVKLKNGQVFILDREDQILLNATKNDLEKMFIIRLPYNWKIEEDEKQTKFLAESTIQIEIDESSKVDLPISLNILLNKDIKPEELWKFVVEWADKHSELTEKSIIDFPRCLVETLLSYKENEKKIREAVQERLNEKITLFEMKEKIVNSISFPQAFSSFEEMVFDIKDILVLKKRNILEK